MTLHMAPSGAIRPHKAVHKAAYDFVSVHEGPHVAIEFHKGPSALFIQVPQGYMRVRRAMRLHKVPYIFIRLYLASSSSISKGRAAAAAAAAAAAIIYLCLSGICPGSPPQWEARGGAKIN